MSKTRVYQSRKIDGLWYFARLTDFTIKRIGLCEELIECTACRGRARRIGGFCGPCNGTGSLPTDCRGHETQHDADKHYYEYLLDHLLDKTVPGANRVCEACGDDTDVRVYYVAGVFENYFVNSHWLCNDCRNRETFEMVEPFKPGYYQVTT